MSAILKKDYNIWECNLCHIADPSIEGGALLNSHNKTLSIHVDCSAKITSVREVLKNWQCCICFEKNPDSEGGVVNHGMQNHDPIHKNCLGNWLLEKKEISVFVCPLCKDPLYPETLYPTSGCSLTDRVSIDWIPHILPWIFNYIYRNDPGLRSVASFTHTTFAWNDLTQIRRKKKSFEEAVLVVDQYLRATPHSGEDRNLYARRCYYQFKKPKLVEAISEQKHLQSLHLIRVLGTAVLGVRSFLEWKNQKR